MLTDSLIRYLVALEPVPPHFRGMGATRLSLDPRDAPVTRYPGVANQIAATPDSASLFPQIKEPPYNQGAEGACVAASTASACTIDTGRSVPEEFNWQTLYSEAGGRGQNGVDSRLVLSNCVKLGVPLVNGPRVPILQSYAFVTQQPGPFRQEIKACIAAGQPVVVALLLPSDFGWMSGHGNATSGYHQVCGFAYDPVYLWIWNSWGNWPGGASPGPGIGSIAWDYLEADGLQHGYCFAYTTSSQPLPPPPPPATVTVTGYLPNPVNGNTLFTIQGSGFTADAKAALANGAPLTVSYSKPTTLAAMAPNANAPVTAPVIVSQASGSATGPPLTVNPTHGPPPPPPPPSGLLLGVSSPPIYHRGLVLASLHKTNGEYPAPGTIVEVKATTPDGQVASGRVTL